jgi:hypothetical protein
MTTLFPRGFAFPVPPAGIRTKGGDTVAQCMTSLHDEYSGPDCQVAFRSHKLGEPGAPLHVSGVINPPVASNIAFGIATTPKNSSVAACMSIEPAHASAGYDTIVNSSESQYHRTKRKLGQVPDGVAVIPNRILESGFGISTQFGETAGAIVQRTLCDTPLNPRVATSYQTNRGYDWGLAKVNPETYRFGRRGEPRQDHVTSIMRWDGTSKVVDLAVDRATHDSILPDPNPLDPKPSIIAHTMRADQLRDTRDVSERGPAGLAPRSGEFNVGDTFATMGLMDSIDADYRGKPKQYNRWDDMRHGIPTPPNPFPNPLYGPGKYAQLGLTNEEFIKVRDKDHIVPVMMTALALGEKEAAQIFEVVAQREGRDLISVAEFHDEFKRMTYN